MVGSLSRLARMAASAISKESCDSTDAYRKLLRMGSCAASLAASFLQVRDSVICYGCMCLHNLMNCESVVWHEEQDV